MVASAGISIKNHEVTSSLTLLQFLNSVETFSVGQTFAKFLICQIEAIKFAFDWNKRGERQGVKEFKRKFTKKSFEADPTYCLLQQETNDDD